MRSRVDLRRIVLAASLLFVPVTGYAQQATVSGVATDSTGGVLPGVVVRAVHEASGNSFESVTDERGAYRLAVRTGVYHITAELSGFTTVNRSGLELLVGQQAVVNLQMSPSTVQESVTVTGEAPLIETTQSSLGSNIDPRQMQDLPVNGRNWMDLTVLTPGSRMNAVDDGSPSSLSGSFQINVDGQEVTMKITATNGQPGYSRDAIGEFEVITNRFDATQGRSSGIQVNAVTKSGTNTPAGTFSGYFRDDRFNSADFVAGKVLPYSDTQLSGTFGGPIRKDRIHFFANYEYEREPQTFVYTTPYPKFNIAVTGAHVEKKGGVRLDFQFSPATRLTLRGGKSSYILPYNVGNGATTHPSTAFSSTRGSEQLLASLTQVLSNRALNEVKVSYAGYVYANTPWAAWPNHPKSFMGITVGAPNIQLTGFNLGSGTTHPQRHPEPDYNVRDDFTYSYNARGRHTLKLGGEYMWIPWLQFSCRFCAGQLDARNGPVPANIEALFPVWNDVSTWNLAGLSSISRRYTIGVGNFRTEPHRHYFAGYTQDDWIITSRLTLNLGVRYDLITGAFAEKVELLPFLKAGRPYDKNNIAPRTGFAFSLNDRTVLRGGFGLYFGDIQRSAAGVTEAWAQQLLVEAVYDGRADFAANPFLPSWPKTFEEMLPRVCTTASVPGCLRRDISANVVYRDSQFPYSYQASFGAQRQLGNTIAIEADYVYSGGRNEQYTRNQNLSYNSATGTNYPFSDISRRPFPDRKSVV